MSTDEDLLNSSPAVLFNALWRCFLNHPSTQEERQAALCLLIVYSVSPHVDPEPPIRALFDMVLRVVAHHAAITAPPTGGVH